MGNTAFFEDATMIDHLRMSITTDDSMTPSPFLKIFIGLMSATDSTATFKTYASNKDALILHGTPMGPPCTNRHPRRLPLQPMQWLPQGLTIIFIRINNNNKKKKKMICHILYIFSRQSYIFCHLYLLISLSNFNHFSMPDH